MSTTTNLGLTKYDSGDETPRRAVHNGNMDLIDAAVGDVDVQADGDLQTQINALRDSVFPTRVTFSGAYPGVNTGTKVVAHIPIPHYVKSASFVSVQAVACRTSTWAAGAPSPFVSGVSVGNGTLEVTTTYDAPTANRACIVTIANLVVDFGY